MIPAVKNLIRSLYFSSLPLTSNIITLTLFNPVRNLLALLCSISDYVDHDWSVEL